MKCLKTYAKKMCEDNDVPIGDIMYFIDSGDIFFMLIDLKITLIKLCEGNRVKRMQELKDALESKDFKNGLYNRLFACMLLPNITAYVTNTQHHIMDFITTHSNVFKIPPGMLEDVELRAQLGKLVTKLLTGIWSVIKNALTASIVKHTSIADVMRALAHSGSGMEVDSTHWNRIALLRRLLRIFLIGVSDYKNASINDLFSPYLIPLLKQDMQCKVECELGVNIAQLEDDLFGTNNALGSNNQASPDTPTGNGHAPSARRIENGANMDDEELKDQSGVQLGGGDANGEEEELNGLGNSVETAAVLLDDPLDSRFGLVEGTPAHYTNTIRFWNFVNHSLLVMCQISKEASSTPAEQEKELQKLFIEIFQADLAEFPGGKKQQQQHSNLLAFHPAKDLPPADQMPPPPDARTVDLDLDLEDEFDNGADWLDGPAAPSQFKTAKKDLFVLAASSGIDLHAPYLCELLNLIGKQPAHLGSRLTKKAATKNLSSSVPNPSAWDKWK
ncbi:uncharacterized protein BJ212DRAFT_1482616 [Suillus subaureus]|uniref:Uncharacterized protein n=1 Tax=Suillus subaureus TaxID=48587 RepID=A0A9P7JBP7_9AGAM|nr:uncharacterized protein BJ212DRAFT_1482616 [Suillus subaureus]KAG1813147.1 hypothetical protein BJ212DRAFT_1482616 [Suillus subaureus]